MLNVTIEIWPWGDVDQRQAIAHVAIWNVGTYMEDDVERADYSYCVTEEADDRFFDPTTLPSEAELRDMARSGTFDDDRIRAHGVIRGHVRRSGATALLARVLNEVMTREAGLPL
jgi:hypothetical protein